MIYEQRKQERQALIDHLLTQDWNVFGTLKFVNGRTIGRSSADKLLRSYWNRIDRMMFGKAAARQNMRVPRWCFAHEGSDCLSPLELYQYFLAKGVRKHGTEALF
jgi:hypothetical protein